MRTTFILTLALAFACFPAPVDIDPEPSVPTITIFDGGLNGEFIESQGPVLRGNVVGLVASGLNAGEAFRFVFENNGYRGEALVTANEEGVADLRDANVTEGSYTGVDVDGFWWSMAFDFEDFDEAKGFELTSITLFNSDDEIIAHRELAWLEAADDIIVESLNVEGAQGVVYRPAGAGPFPATIVFGGSEGGLFIGEARARDLASRGIIGVGIAYFAAEGLPAQLANVSVEYVEDIIDHVLTRDDVRGDSVGVWGASRGGEYALLLASTLGDKIGATLAEVPSGVSWGSGLGASWTVAEEPFSFVGSHGGMPDVQQAPDGNSIYYFRQQFETDLRGAPGDEVAAATFEVENSSGPIMMIAGEDDQIWPSCDLAEISWLRLETAGRNGDEFICYPNVGHALIKPGWPTTTLAFTFSATFNGWLANGGEAAASAAANRDRYSRIFDFLKNSL